MVSLPLQITYEFYDKNDFFVIGFSEDNVKVKSNYSLCPGETYNMCRLIGNHDGIKVPNIGLLRIVILDLQYQTQFRNIFLQRYDCQPRSHKRRLDCDDNIEYLTNSNYIVDRMEGCSALIHSKKEHMEKIKITILYSSLIESMKKNYRLSHKPHIKF